MAHAIIVTKCPNDDLLNCVWPIYECFIHLLNLFWRICLNNLLKHLSFMHKKYKLTGYTNKSTVQPTINGGTALKGFLVKNVVSK